MITIFEKYNNKPDVNSVSSEFWKMIEIADWNSVIKYYQYLQFPTLINPYEYLRNSVGNFFEKVQLELYKKYEYDQIKKFCDELHIFYQELYLYFSEYFEKLNPKSFDQYSDDFQNLITSTIGKGKKIIKKCIDDPRFLLRIEKSNDYVEGFEDLLDVTETEYWDIKSQDPFFKDVKKFNL